MVNVGENDIKDIRVPIDGLAFNTFFDILGGCQYETGES
jgi:hypothetical protein